MTKKNLLLKNLLPEAAYQSPDEKYVEELVAKYGPDKTGDFLKSKCANRGLETLPRPKSPGDPFPSRGNWKGRLAIWAKKYDESTKSP